MPVSRRDAVKGLAALTGLVAAGCGAGRPTLRVAVVWSGWELTQFKRVLRAFPGDFELSVQSVGDDIGALLGRRVAAAATPDLAIVPRPGLVSEYRSQLAPLTPMTDSSRRWQDLLTFGGEVYGRWFKVAHKSLVWHRADLLGPAPVPWGWDSWVQRCRTLAEAGTPPLAIGAADGWVLTDWFENVLLGLAPDTYRSLVTDPTRWTDDAVREALRRLGTVWSIPGAFPGGPGRAVLTQFDESVLEVFEHGRAAMVVGADFVWPVVTHYTGFARERVGWLPFPHGDSGHRPVLVAGDAAVLLRPGSAGGRTLIEWLASPDAAATWAAEGGFLSVDGRVRGYPTELRAGPLVEDVSRGSGDGGSVTFDLSDQLSGRLAGGEGRGIWKIFEEFFVEVTAVGSGLEAAVDRAVDALSRAARHRGGR